MITKLVVMFSLLVYSITCLVAQNEIKIIDRYIAIDNVCAWPNLTLMPDGTIIATIFNQPTHGGWEGDVECWASTDGGHTWEYRGTPARHEPGTNRMNVAAGLAHNGDLIVIASGWSHKSPPGEPAPKGTRQVLDSWVCRSSDGGRIWEVSISAIIQPPEVEQILIPHGDIVQVSKNKLAATFYRNWVSYILFSNDDGRTWGKESILLTKDAGEPFLLPLRDIRWLAVARSSRDRERDRVVNLGEYLRYFVSEDEGQNWIEDQHLTGSSQHPGHLLRLSDGRILLTYGNRRSPSPSIQILLSDDEGESWNFHARDLVSLHGTVIRQWGYGDMGYPSTVQLEDGTLVTAYYAWSIESHRRYHMGVVRWKLE